MPGPSVLVVDDDRDLLEGLRGLLTASGFAVQTASSLVTAYRQLRDGEPDILVLDISLDRCFIDGVQVDDGLGLLRLIRRQSNVPIVMLSATTVDSVKILALELGADDYITKPFSFGELSARLHAVVRRSAGDGAAKHQLRFGGLRIDLDTHEARVGDRRERLTLSEFRVLERLVRARGRTLSRRQLLEAIHGVEHHGRCRAVDVHIRHLRQKLEEDPGFPRLLLTVRGLGYRLARVACPQSSM